MFIRPLNQSLAEYKKLPHQAAQLRAAPNDSLLRLCQRTLVAALPGAQHTVRRQQLEVAQVPAPCLPVNYPLGQQILCKQVAGAQHSQAILKMGRLWLRRASSYFQRKVPVTQHSHRVSMPIIAQNVRWLSAAHARVCLVTIAYCDYANAVLYWA